MRHTSDDPPRILPLLDIKYYNGLEKLIFYLASGTVLPFKDF